MLGTEILSFYRAETPYNSIEMIAQPLSSYLEDLHGVVMEGILAACDSFLFFPGHCSHLLLENHWPGQHFQHFLKGDQLVKTYLFDSIR